MVADYMRRVIFAPYRKGAGPRFELTLWESKPDPRRARCMPGELIRYTLRQIEAGKAPVTIFAGFDYGCAPSHSIDGDASVEGLMSFLTLRPGDTDAEYFENYTDAQRTFCDAHAEALSFENLCRFGEKE